MLTQIINFNTFNISAHKLVIGHKKKALYDFVKSDICVSISGEIINESFRKILPFYLFMYWLAWKCGNDVIMFPQSIGPLKRRWTRLLTRFVLSKCKIVTARDEVSFRELQSLGLNHSQITLSPDVGVSQPLLNQKDAIIYLNNLGVTTNSAKLWIGITVSSWTEEGVTPGDYINALIKALIKLAHHCDIGLLIMPANMPANGNNYNDYNASKYFYDSMKQYCHTVILKPSIIPARLFKAVTKELDLFISTRMHASILSTMAGTPTITINTQRKVPGYMALIGQKKYSLDPNRITSELLYSTVNNALSQSHYIRTELNTAKLERNNKLDKFISDLDSIFNELPA
jgi:polysaccharide pyruvyl transferase WcaK-like protein